MFIEIAACRSRRKFEWSMPSWEQWPQPKMNCDGFYNIKKIIMKKVEYEIFKCLLKI